MKTKNQKILDEMIRNDRICGNCKHLDEEDYKPLEDCLCKKTGFREDGWGCEQFERLKNEV